MDTKTCVCFVGDDAYEITYTKEQVTAIVRYKHGMNVRGEEVNFDNLHEKTQLAIYNRLRRELERERRYNEERIERERRGLE